MEEKKIVEDKVQPPVEKACKDEDLKEFLWISPYMDCDCGSNDTSKDVSRYTFEIPGVKRDNIHLDIVKDGLRLTADRSDGYSYRSELEFVCPVKTEDVKARYEEGILNVEVPFACEDPFRDAKSIKID